MLSKILFKFDDLDYFSVDLEKYLTSLKGVRTAKFNDKKEELEVLYDSKIIFLKTLYYEIKEYLKSSDIPLLLGFSKNETTNIKETIIYIPDICCEYCLKDKLEELLFLDGVIKVSTNYDDLLDANVFITYDETLNKEENLASILAGEIVKL